MYLSQLQHVILEVGRRFYIDVIPPNDDERLADRISLVLGGASDFDAEYGYYAQGVTSLTPTFAPRDSKSRAIPVRVERYTGWCAAKRDSYAATS